MGIPETASHQLRRALGRVVGNLSNGRGSKLLCLMMGPAGARLVPDGIWNRCALHCWDTWPENFSVWDSLFTRFRTQIAFFTSRQARDRFQSRFPGMKCCWMPDGSNPGAHHPEKLLADRIIDVLELGRRHHPYHAAIAPQLLRDGRKHLFESPPGKVVFPRREEMLNGLADSKIVVCFPSSVTLPDRAAIETITPRYFEAMASGSIVVGHCPTDLIELFGYNPVIEADLENPAAQIARILSSIEEHQPLIRRNLEKVYENTWLHRARAAKLILEAADPPA